MPPLRDRKSDIPLLASHFVGKYCRLYELQEKSLSEKLLDRFQAYDWPGNVRELENMVQRGVLLSAERAVVEVSDVYDDFFTDSGAGREHSNGGSNADTIEDMERNMIMGALQDTNNNQQDAADKLGISARTIRNKLRKYREEGLIE